MKVLSLTESYATLIKEKRKLIETRSWKTSYRGELYIHANMTKPQKNVLENKDLMSLVKNKDMNFGKIICKCNLVDCIYITKEFIESMKKNNYQEYICGNYEEGRYAWILENIETIKSIDVKVNIKMYKKLKIKMYNFYIDSDSSESNFILFLILYELPFILII